MYFKEILKTCLILSSSILFSHTSRSEYLYLNKIVKYTIKGMGYSKQSKRFFLGTYELVIQKYYIFH